MCARSFNRVMRRARVRAAPTGRRRDGTAEVQDDPTDRANDVDADRDEGLPQPRDLRATERGPVGVELELLEEHKSRRRQRDAQLIGPEARATGAPEGEGEFQFLEAILTVAAGAIDLGVDPFGRLTQIRDDKVRVIARLAALMPHDFGFDDRAPGRLPRARLIVRLRIGRCGVMRRGHDRPERRDRRLGVPGEDRVPRHRDDILDPGPVQVIKDLRRRIAGIESDAQPGTGKGAPQFREQPMQHADRAGRPRRVARAEDRGDEVLPRLVVKVRLATSGR